MPSETLIRCLGFIFDFDFDLIRACMHSTRLLRPTHAAELQYLADGAPPLPSLPPALRAAVVLVLVNLQFNVAVRSLYCTSQRLC